MYFVLVLRISAIAGSFCGGPAGATSYTAPVPVAAAASFLVPLLLSRRGHSCMKALCLETQSKHLYALLLLLLLSFGPALFFFFDGGR